MADLEQNANEEFDNIVELTDDDGNTVAYEMLDYIELDGKEYIVITPALEEEPEDEDECDVYIMRVTKDGEEDVFETITDENEMNKVFSEFRNHVENDFDFAE